jgi:heptosyltransferase-2
MKKRILVLRFSSIGDIVLTTPVIRCLKQQIPNCELHFLTKPSYKDFLETNPNIDHLHFLDKHPILKGLELKKYGFDFVIDLHNNLRTSMIKAVLDVTSFSFPKLNIEKFQTVQLKTNTLPSIHIVDRYFDTVKNLLVYNDGKGLDYFINDIDISKVKNKTSDLKDGFIAWAIGGQHATKQLPFEKILEISQKIQTPIILLGGKEDTDLGDKIVANSTANIRNFCGKLSLNESAACLKLSKFVLTNDTGLMHIAAALQKPIFSFWGNTIPEFGMYPYYGISETKQEIFQIENLKCRPCSKIGFEKCPHTHFKCMFKINSQEVFHQINRALSL